MMTDIRNVLDRFKLRPGHWRAKSVSLEPKSLIVEITSSSRQSYTWKIVIGSDFQRPPTYAYGTTFDANNAAYQRRVQISHEIKPGESDRFTVKIALPASSFHRFHTTIRDISGLTLRSLPIELNCSCLDPEGTRYRGQFLHRPLAITPIHSRHENPLFETFRLRCLLKRVFRMKTSDALAAIAIGISLSSLLITVLFQFLNPPRLTMAVGASFRMHYNLNGQIVIFCNLTLFNHGARYTGVHLITGDVIDKTGTSIGNFRWNAFYKEKNIAKPGTAFKFWNNFDGQLEIIVIPGYQQVNNLPHATALAVAPGYVSDLIQSIIRSPFGWSPESRKLDTQLP